jgi:hypothetical protein
MKIADLAANVSSGLGELLQWLPEDEDEELKKDMQSLIDRLDKKFKLHTICLEF